MSAVLPARAIAPRRRGLSRAWQERLAPWICGSAMLLIWEVAVRVLAVPVFVLPAPSVIAVTLYERWSTVERHAIVTLWTTLVGFALAVVGGLILGLVVGWSRAIYSGLYPLMIGFNSVPKVAVVPILVIWFGVGVVPAIITAFLISFFPVVVNVATGLATIEPETEDVLRALGASKWDVMTKIGIPRALPYFFGSLKVAITLAFVGTVVSETIAANEGLGYMMAAAQSQGNVRLIFAGLVGLAVEGIVMYALMAWIEGATTGWARRGQQR